MRAVVVGTAGHIDHGKTALVRRLTGIDTDRLKEEKERGISIDIGFAHCTFPSGQRIAIIDVPGHERFVKNMLAGATGVDLVLLVVAADEGVMPQTREHLAIVNLLRVDRGVVALTKSDLVDEETLRAVRAEVEDLLASTPLRGAPILPVSAVTGEGLDALVLALDRAAREVGGRDASGPVRLPVDRVFSVEGIGTVVTGTLWSGSVRVGDTLELLPQGRPVRVRQTQVHDHPVVAATAGQRAALAIHGAGREEISRGDWLVTPGRFRASHLLDVRVRLLADAPKPLGSRTRLRFHLGASEILGRAVLLDRETLVPGDEAWVQLRLESPAVAAWGDRVVIRSYSPAATIAGAEVVDPTPPKRVRLKEGDAARLQTLRSGSLGERLAVLAREAAQTGVRDDEAAVRLSVSPAAIAEGASAAAPASLEIASGAALVRLRDGALLDPAAWRGVLARIVGEVKRYCEANRLRDGVPKGELKSLLKREMPAPVFDEALGLLLAGRRLSLRDGRVVLPEAGPTLKPEQARRVEEMERKLAGQGFQVPELSELTRGIPATERPHELVRYLVDSGRVVKVTSELLYPRTLWDEVESRIRTHFKRKPALTMAEFKDLFAVSRKYAVPLLEHLDRTGLTHRQGDERVPGPKLTK